MPKTSILTALYEELNLTISAFEREIGMSNASIKKSIEANKDITDKMISKISKTYPQVNRKWLETGEGNIFLDEKDIPPSTVGMSEGERMRFEKAVGKVNQQKLGLIHVPIAAQAGYSRNFEDPVFVGQLERIYIPGLPYKGDKFRYFDVEGDSMEPTLEDGMQVIGEEIEQEHWKHISDYYIYIIVKMNRVLIKRLFRKDDTNLVLISDNEVYAQELLPIEEIKELWLVKRKLDWRMTPPKRFEIKV